jgi:hypothetical protein
MRTSKVFGLFLLVAIGLTGCKSTTEPRFPDDKEGGEDPPPTEQLIVDLDRTSGDID